MHRWRENNDVIIESFFLYVQHKILYFGFFPLLRINEMAPFYNLFIKQLSYFQYYVIG